MNRWMIVERWIMPLLGCRMTCIRPLHWLIMWNKCIDWGLRRWLELVDCLTDGWFSIWSEKWRRIGFIKAALKQYHWERSHRKCQCLPTVHQFWKFNNGCGDHNHAFNLPALRNDNFHSSISVIQIHGAMLWEFAKPPDFTVQDQHCSCNVVLNSQISGPKIN